MGDLLENMGMKVKQVFLKPGTYKPGGKKHRVTLTADEIRQYVEGTRQVLAAGYQPPVLFGHAPILSEEGAPKSRDQKADEVKHGAGWLEDLEIGEDGAASYVLDITDSEAARKFNEGSIRFTSPELRRVWKDGQGNLFQNVISHVALTHKPVNIDQGAVEQSEALQFSLDDLESGMADDDDKPKEGDDTPAESESKPDNPDMPEGSNESDTQRAQRLEAIIGHLDELGVAMPADTAQADIDVILDRLLTALMSAAAAKKKAEPETPAETPEDPPPPVVEQQGAMQYSLDDIDSLENKLLAKVIRGEHASLVAKLSGMVGKNKLTEAARDQLLALDGAMQFSTDGEFVPTLSINRVVDLLDECLPDGMALTQEQIISQFAIEEHPDEKHYKKDGMLTEAEAKRFVDEQAKQMPGVFRQRETVS